MRRLVTVAAALALAGVMAIPLRAAAHHPGRTADVRKAQQALKDAGYDPGPIDGKMGKQTHQAVKEFQQAKNLQPTGRLDHQTRAALTGGDSATSGAGAQGTGRQPVERGTDMGTGTHGGAGSRDMPGDQGDTETH